MSRWQRRPWFPAAAAVAVLLLGSGILAQTTVDKRVGASHQIDEEFARLVREWTTRPEFLSPLVDHLPKVLASQARKTCSVITSASRRS